MPYEAVATTKTPALVIYLIDNSGSMDEVFEQQKKIDHVNEALESTLERMVQRSTKGEIISPRYRLALVAYSDTPVDILGGIDTITEVAKRGKPVLSATNATDTHAAFVWARDLLRRELPSLRGKPAPMVCHLTDGQFTGPDPEAVAIEIMGMSNDDGPVLIENIFLGPNLTTSPISNLETWPGVRSIDELQNDYAKKLFRMSSLLPDSYAALIAEEGYGMQPGARMLIPGTSRELIELAFAMSGATPVA